MEIENLIVGAGLSGLIMGHLLKDRCVIIEKSPELNLNTAGPFYLHQPAYMLPVRAWKQIDVHQNCWDGAWFHRVPNLGVMNAYARKITGKIINTSLMFMDGSIKKGYLPASGEPSQVLQDLYEAVRERVLLNQAITKLDPSTKLAWVQDKVIKYQNLISTMPLPALLKMIGMEVPYTFTAEPIYARIYGVGENDAVDSYQIIYITSNKHKIYRAALMHNTIFLEAMEDFKEEDSLPLIEKLWGFSSLEFKEQRTIRPGKFHPIEKTKRKMLLGKLTAEHDIYCLGRYAVWDYKRLDHIIEDANQILDLLKAKASV